MVKPDRWLLRSWEFDQQQQWGRTSKLRLVSKEHCVESISTLIGHTWALNFSIYILWSIHIRRRLQQNGIQNRKSDDIVYPVEVTFCIQFQRKYEWPPPSHIRAERSWACKHLNIPVHKVHRAGEKSRQPRFLTGRYFVIKFRRTVPELQNAKFSIGTSF